MMAKKYQSHRNKTLSVEKNREVTIKLYQINQQLKSVAAVKSYIISKPQISLILCLTETITTKSKWSCNTHNELRLDKITLLNRRRSEIN